MSTVPTTTQEVDGLVRLLLFALDGQRFALRLGSVRRIVWMVKITPLPAAPRIVLGVVDMHGAVVPVVDIRRRFGLPHRAPDPGQKLIIADAAGRHLALAVDDIGELLELNANAIAAPDPLAAGEGYVAGIARSPDGLVVIHDLETFLSVDEETDLDEALASNGKSEVPDRAS